MSSPADYRIPRTSQAQVAAPDEHEHMSEHASEHASEHTSERTSVTPRASFGIPRPQKSLLRRQHSPPPPAPPPPPPPPAAYSRSFSSPRGAGLPVRTAARGLGASPHIVEEAPRGGLLDPDFAASVAGAGAGGKSAGSASTVSTAAASSVWDELDDLKSRIRRLEVTGHIPAASSRAGDASNSSGDRPRTATTTVTTMSSSPRHKVGHGTVASPIHSTFGGALATTTTAATAAAAAAAATTSHPLLHTALAKSKAVLPPDVYRHLELAAKDALDLANTVGAPGAASTATNAAVNGDRTVRRKADSVCRSLTELCLALSEHRHNMAPPAHHPFIQAQFGASRPASRLVTGDLDRESAVGSSRQSVVGDGLRSRPVAMGRFAERKNSFASLHVAAAAAGFSPRSDPITSSSSITAAGAVATAGTIRHRSSMGLKAGFTERDRERFRAPSRAATEVGVGGGGGGVAPQRLRLSHPISREYTPPESGSSARRSLALPITSGAMSSPLVVASSPVTTTRRFFSDGPRRSQDFTPINDRLVGPASADTTRYSTGSIGRSGLRSLRESVDLDGDDRRLTAVKRAEAATERLLRR